MCGKYLHNGFRIINGRQLKNNQKPKCVHHGDDHDDGGGISLSYILVLDTRIMYRKLQQKQKC